MVKRGAITHSTTTQARAFGASLESHGFVGRFSVLLEGPLLVAEVLPEIKTSVLTTVQIRGDLDPLHVRP